MIVAAGVGLGLGYNALSPEPLPWVGKAKPPLPTLDSTLFEDTTSTSSKTPIEIIEVPDTSRTGIDRDHITPQPVDTPTSAIDSATVSERPTEEPTVTHDTTSAAESSTSEQSWSGIPESEAPTQITLSQAKLFHDAGGVLILDARDAAEYAEGHIQGAVSAPTDEKVSDITWLEQTAKDPRPIVIYCGGGDCTLSIELANELLRTGHRRVLIFEEGFPAWQGAGYPVQTGSSP